MSSATMLITLIMGLIAGPAVSLQGSPTVSPVTAALWVSLPFLPCSSINFLALSQAPPPLVIEMATNSPVTILPTNTPPSACGPRITPTRMGEITGISPGIIIFRIAARVTISTQVPYSGLPVPSIIPLISLNCLRTSSTTRPAACPTAFRQRAPKINGNIPPRNSPTRTLGFERSNVLAVLPFATSRANSANRTTAAKPAEPIAYPLVTALVVLPTASSGSVMLRTSFPRWAISAIPPALSVIGPKASMATTIPAIESIETAATATPYSPPLYAPPQPQQPTSTEPPPTPHHPPLTA